MTALHKTLGRALSLRRPHGGRNVFRFTNWLANHLPPRTAFHYDAAGNLHVPSTTPSRTLFVAHVDTVHREDGANWIRKTKECWHAKGAPLGADDGAGVAILMHMLHNNVPGYYIFTQGEERGGIGAKHLATHHKPLLSQFDRAIAFDRKGIDSIITHQGWGRCCSDEFAEVLSAELGRSSSEELEELAGAGETLGELWYSADDTGVYTDTAEFTDDIPECTNISVGYYNEHTDKERLDMVHFQTLADAVLKVRWEELPVQRDPSVGMQGYGDEYWDADEIDIREAVQEAREGDYEWLFEMAAYEAHPEDAKMARTHMRPGRLTPRALDWVEQFAQYPSHALMGLYEEVT